MRDLQQAFWLTKYEFKHSIFRYVVFLSVGITFLLFLVIPVIPSYFLGGSHSFNLDILFLLVFITIFQWARPKISQIQKVNGFFWASHFVVALNHLPFTKEVIVKYRFLSYFIISLFISLLFLGPLYILSPILQNLMPIENFLVFSLVWYCLAISIGSSQLVSDAGTHMLQNFAFTLFVIAPLFLIFGFILFYKVYPHGFVHWTMFISINYPLWTIIVSLFLAIIGSNFWIRRMHRKMSRVDYF